MCHGFVEATDMDVFSSTIVNVLNRTDREAEKARERKTKRC